MLSVLPRQALCLVVALISVGPAVSPAQLTAQSINASAITSEQEEALLKHLRQNHKPAVDFVVGKFAKHDVVMVGETHQVAENCKFVQSLIGPLYGRGVRLMIWEFTRSRQDKDLNRLLIADEFDEALAAAIFREHPWATWGYKDYVDVLQAVWTCNRSLPGHAPYFHVVGMDESTWTQHAIWFKGQTPTETFQHMVAREKHMTSIVREQSLKKNVKALVYVGHAHTNMRQGIRMGKVLRDEYGSRITQVVLHHNWPAQRRQSAPVTGVLERLAKQAGENNAIGFDIAGTPLNRLRDPRVAYWPSIRDATLADFANSYVFLQSLDKLHNATWIPGFINKENFEPARDIAIKMKWVEKGTVTSAAQLDELLLKKFAGQGK